MPRVAEGVSKNTTPVRAWYFMTTGRRTSLSRLATALGRPALWVGVALGSAFTAAAIEWLPSVNWVGAVPPVDSRPLIIRKDAKGDGHFWAVRSGHRRHRGIDLIAEMGSPVRAVRSGIVVQTGSHRGLGRFVEIEHRDGINSLYAHLDDVLAQAGAHVRQGEVIGTVGKTGNARHPWITPHVHFELIKGGMPLDPQSLGLPVVEPPGAKVLAVAPGRPTGDIVEEESEGALDVPGGK